MIDWKGHLKLLAIIIAVGIGINLYIKNRNQTNYYEDKLLKEREMWRDSILSLDSILTKQAMEIDSISNIVNELETKDSLLREQVNTRRDEYKQEIHNAPHIGDSDIDSVLRSIWSREGK